ncbi:MAG TPA: hypothetical protein VGG19_14775 [Tepidisphaeraceae bacterium]
MRHKKNRHAISRWYALVGLSTLVYSPLAQATTRAWVDSTGNWSTTTNWSPAAVPVATDIVNITETDGVNRTITYDYTGSAVTLNSLTIDLTNYTGTATTLFSMAANNLSATNEYVGDSGAGNNGTGIFNQTGGSNTIAAGGELYIGYYSADKGFYYLNGTASLTGNGSESVGYTGTGNFNQSGGTNTINAGSILYVGVFASSNGTYTLSGTGTLSGGTEEIGYGGTGTFNQSGGSNTIASGSALYISSDSGSNGTYNLSSTGALSVTGNEYVGYAGTGIFNHTGGTNTISSGNNLYLGFSSGSSGTYTLGIGGTLTVGGNVYVGGTSTAAGGKGVLTVSGGDLYLMSNTGTLTVYNTAGSGLTVNNSGSITVGSLNLSGNLNLLNWSGGEIDLSNESITIDNSSAANFGDSGSAAGTLTMAASQTLSVSGSETIGYNSTGAITQAGTNTVGTDINLGYNTGSTGSLTLNSVATLTVGGNLYVGGSLFGPGGKGALTVGGASSVTIPSTNALTVYNTSGSSLALSGGTLSTGSLNLSGNLSLFNWTSGTLVLTDSNFNAIFDTAANGGNIASTLALSASKSLSVAGQEIIGNSGSVTATQTGGTNTITGASSIFVLGYNAGSSGSYTLSGTGVLSLLGSNGASEAIGFYGTGTFNQTGGSNILGNATNQGNLLVNASTVSTGTYTLSGGALYVAGIEAVGVYGTGTFTQTGGTNTTIQGGGNGGELDLGIFLGGVGTYNLSGGSFSSSNDVTVGGESAADTGSVAAPAGMGVLSVTNGATMTIGGTLTIFNTPGTSVTLNGGTINTAQLDFNGLPSLFNWTSGTLNITSDVTWDSGAANTSTSDAFLTGLTLSSGQTLMVTGNETIGGTGAFTLTLNSGSTHYVSENITLTSSGTLTQNAGSTLYFSTFTQAGGTINGNFQNQGVFTYQSGTFNARLINQGSVNLGPSFTAANGILNDANISLTPGELITVNGSGLDNLGTLYISGATLAGSGAITNDFGGLLQGSGTISPAFTNDGLLNLTGVLTFTNAAAATNIGTIEGSGTIVGNFSNTGGTIFVTNTLAISSAWTNAGLINIEGYTPMLGGGAITNTGTIQGNGGITSPIINSTGSISATSGELILSAAGITNASAGQIQATAGSTLLITQGLATNAGVISLVGGTFDNDGHAMNNTGQITGYGILRTGALTNNGAITLTGGASTINGNITNSAGKSISIQYNPAIFTGNITNNGTILVVGTTVTFGGTYSGNAYISDPATNVFQNNVTIIPGGTMTGSAGDKFIFTGGTFANTGTFTNAGLLQSSDPSTNSGTFTQSGPQSWSPATTFTNTAGAATFNTDVGSALASPLSITANGGQVIFGSDQHLASLSISSPATVNILGNEIFVASTPAATIRSYLASAYDHGAWGNSGLFSSLISTKPGTSVGYATTASGVEIEYTWLGDANLDGVVNSSDLSAMSSSGTTWQTGDFNYDGKVNADDYSLFMLGAAGSGGMNISTTLPEPFMAGVLALVILPARIRKRS